MTSPAQPPTASPRLAVGTGHLSLDAVVAAAVEAERQQCSCVYVGEGGLEVDAIVASAAALAATSRIRIGPGVVSVAERHPLALARAIASLDRLGGGRALVAVGRGDLVRLAREEGASPTAAMLEETVAVLRAVLTGRPADLEGGAYTARTGTPPDRARAGGRVPIAMAAVGPRTLRLAGAVADVALLNYGATPEYVRWARQRVAEGAVAAGRDADAVELHGYVLATAGGAEAVAEVTRALTEVVADPLQASALLQPAGLLGAPLEGPTLRRLAAIGPPAEIEARLLELGEAGLDTAVLLPHGLAALRGG